MGARQARRERRLRNFASRHGVRRWREGAEYESLVVAGHRARNARAQGLRNFALLLLSAHDASPLLLDNGKNRRKITVLSQASKNTRCGASRSLARRSCRPVMLRCAAGVFPTMYLSRCSAALTGYGKIKLHSGALRPDEGRCPRFLQLSKWRRPSQTLRCRY